MTYLLATQIVTGFAIFTMGLFLHLLKEPWRYRQINVFSYLQILFLVVAIISKSFFSLTSCSESHFDTDKRQADSAEHPGVRHALDVSFSDPAACRASYVLQVQIRLPDDLAAHWPKRLKEVFQYNSCCAAHLLCFFATRVCSAAPYERQS